MKFVLEDIHYVKSCKKVLFLSVFHRGLLCTGLNQKKCPKMITFQNDGGGGRCRFSADLKKNVFL